MGSIGDTQAHIPVIDISEANSANAPKQLLQAAIKHGFVFIRNNEGVMDSLLIAKLFNLAKDFFALPTEVKNEVSIGSNKAGKNYGWLGQGVEKLDPKQQERPDVKEAFNMALPDPQTGVYEQKLPDLLQQDISTIRTFQSACHDLCQRVFKFLALGLEIEEDWFTSRHDLQKGPTGTIFRLLYYPRHNAQRHLGTDIRAGAHSDYGSVTCLFQLPGQPGLEILTPDGNWAAVPVDPEGEGGDRLPILVNIGDLLEDWTGGLLKSTKHRVVFPAEEAGDRYSIAYFCHPLDDALLEPVPSEIVREREKKHGRKEVKVITAKDHLMERLAATYSVK
ncbi:related to gibberellin 20-oxidase [Lecanosticta acicola]|uniref:Related to gibberellin 20-oxidase n=1 Tax=Lecanosticta acicola TaxID=111012 RepID=A0AAI8YS53_9PEZI|nr:related to gibberellin 20-oxidase [Lecanosticta acicola]